MIDKRFGTTDYLIFSASLVVSLLIGVLSAFCDRKKSNDSTKHFYFGNQDLNIFAVALSMSATFLSAIGVLGGPAEVYMFGISTLLTIVGDFVAQVATIFVFIPFFWRLKTTSVYEYLEKRFNKTVRRCGSLLFVISMVLYVSIAMYAPSLALSQVSGLSLWVSILCTGLICTIYTSVGGMKAVVWTDAFQMCVMLVGVFACLTVGFLNVGGVSEVFRANQEAERLFISTDPDPRVRHSVWSLTIGGAVTFLPLGINQATVQRYFSVKSKTAAQKMFALQTPIFFFWKVMLVLLGMILVAYYRGCDPVLANRISRPDQIVAIFVLDVLYIIPGLPGLFVSVVYSASLSTISSGINSIVVAVNEDFVKPACTHFNTKWDDQTFVRISKVASFFVGIMLIGLAYCASFAGTQLSQFCLSVVGVCGGPMLAIFVLGMTTTSCNSKGATCGLIAGLSVAMWILIGAIASGVRAVPLTRTTDFCEADIIGNRTSSFNQTFARFPYSIPTNATDGAMFLCKGPNGLALASSTPCQEDPAGPGGIQELYRVSYQYYSLIGFLVTCAVAIAISWLTGWNEGTVIPREYLMFARESQSSKMTEEHLALRTGMEYDFVNPVYEKKRRLDMYD